MKLVGKGGISVEMIKHSRNNVSQKDMITLVAEYPRYIHSQLMTHRMLSKNSSSSRAIPVSTMIDNVLNSDYTPIYWGKNQKGMVADEECTTTIKLESDFNNALDKVVGILESYQIPVGNSGAGELAAEWTYDALKDIRADVRSLKVKEIYTADELFVHSKKLNCEVSKAYADAGYHKEIVNRLTEPYQMMRVIISGTEWANFFHLRKHGHAQKEIYEVARLVSEVIEQSTPELLKAGEYHVPFVSTVRDDSGDLHYFIPTLCGDLEVSALDAIKVSISSCAQVSYRKLDTSLAKAEIVFNMLNLYDADEPMHASPTEHIATPIDEDDNINTNGITAFHKELGYMSGNLAGWIQYRHLIPNNTKY